MRGILLVFLPCTFFALCSYAQTDEEALRYSQTNIGGTARSMGAGGAFGALGADFTSLSINPAGVAMYRKLELTLTPSIVSISNKSEYYGSKTDAYKFNFNFSNIGVVIPHLNTDSKGQVVKNGWVGWSFGVGLNRLNNFHRNLEFEGVNTDNSLVDKYIEDANGISYTEVRDALPFGAGLAWNTFLLDTITGFSNQYLSPINNGGVRQIDTIISRGAMNEWLLSVGGNHSNKLYIGATVGFPTIRYNEEKIYLETDEQDTINNFKSFILTENLRTRGQGFDLKLGIILRAGRSIRLGASVKSPTYYYMTDEYNTGIAADMEAWGSFTDESPEGLFNYRLTTPWKFTGSMAIIVKKAGYFSVDYELIDYGTAHYNFSKGNAEDEQAATTTNNTIDSKYRPTSNIRLGGEYKYQRYAFRAGYGLYLSPFNSSANLGGANYIRHVVSVGFGIRAKDYFLDLAFVRNSTEEIHVPYSLSTETTQGAVSKLAYNNLVATVGLKL